MNEVWPALFLSLRIAICATAVAGGIGIPLAFLMARRPFVGRAFVEGLILLPMVLPPTVVGYVLLVLLGRGGWISRWLGDYSVVFSFEGAVLAAAVVALPMLYLPAKAGFGGVDQELEDAAKLEGATLWGLFWRVSVPLARRGLMAGTILGFARAIGEFGATVMVFGWQPGRVTLPVMVYAAYESGQLQNAGPAVAVMAMVSLGLVMVFNGSWGSGRR